MTGVLGVTRVRRGRRRAIGLLVATLGVLGVWAGGIAPSAFGSANDQASCLGLNMSTATPGTTGPIVSAAAHENQPLGQRVSALARGEFGTCTPH
jgi:hypothetical protein